MKARKHHTKKKHMSEEQTQTQTQEGQSQSQTQAPVLAGTEMEVTDAKQKDQPVVIEADQALIDLFAQCPHSWQGDAGFQNWAKLVYDHGVASVPPVEPPPPQ